MREFEAAQAQAMELLLQQCVESAGSELRVNTRQNATNAATLMDMLAQSCEDANAMVQDMSYEDVATKLAHAVAATQESLRSVRDNVNDILDDPEKMRTLCQNLQSVDQPLMLAAMDGQTAAAGSSSTQLIVPSDEENVRHMMAFAENMCGVLDDALSTITKDELVLAAQLSLGITQKILEAGQSLFLSLGDEERERIHQDQAGRITIEELPDDEDKEDQKIRNRRRSRPKQQQRHNRKHAAVLRTSLENMAKKTRDRATEHPFLAGALTAVSLPFVGLAIPVASVVGLGLMMEKYYPEHTSLTVEMFSNFMQMTKLSILLMKISARQMGVVARECFRSWYEYASANGFLATGMELASTSYSVGCFCDAIVSDSSLRDGGQPVEHALLFVFHRLCFEFHEKMGVKQSKLKKELEALKKDAIQKAKKHEEEMEVLRSDKRMLEYKLGVLQELTAQAQMEAEKAMQSALESEERMKAMEWELVRKLSVSTTSTSSSPSSASSTPSSSTVATSLASSSALIPRVPLNWKLRDDVALRRSSTAMLSKLKEDSSGLHGTRPHSQSAPAAPQTLMTKKQQTASDNQKSKAAKQAEPAAIAIGASTTELQSISVPASSDDEASSDTSQTRRGASGIKNSKRPQRRGGGASKSNDPSKDDGNGSDSSSSRRHSKSRGKSAEANLKFSDDEESN